MQTESVGRAAMSVLAIMLWPARPSHADVLDQLPRVAFGRFAEAGA
jgi:hypothetical protein